LLHVQQILVQGHLLPDQALDGQPLDDLILIPHSKLAGVGFHLHQHGPSGHLRTDVRGDQIDIDTAIVTHMTQIPLLIQTSQPGMWVDLFWQGW